MNKFAIGFICILTVSTALAKPKPKVNQLVLPPPRDTSIEDVETLDSLINSKNPSARQKDEMQKLAKLTLERSPKLREFFDNWQVATLTKKITRAKMLPSLGISNTIGKQGLDPTFTGPKNNYGNLTLSVSELLYDNGVTLNTLDLNTKAEERSRLEYEYTRDQQLLAVMQAYLDWSQALQAQDLDESKRKILQRQLAFMDSQFRQGYKTRRDVLRLESELRRLHLDTLHDESNVVVNRAKLLGLLGIKTEEFDELDIHGEETGAVEDPGAETNIPLNITDHRRLKILGYREQEADVAVRLAQRDYWPNLSFHANAAYENDNYLQPGVNFNSNYIGSWEALVVLSWTIWDWGIKSRNIQVAKVRADTVAQKDRQEELDLSVQLQQVMRNILEFNTSLTLSHELMTLERQNYTALENDYRNGRAGYLDLITGINDYIDARTRFMAAYFDLRRQKLAYEFHLGDLYKNLSGEKS